VHIAATAFRLPGRLFFVFNAFCPFRLSFNELNDVENRETALSGIDTTLAHEDHRD
jgi:hypothetical protein